MELVFTIHTALHFKMFSRTLGQKNLQFITIIFCFSDKTLMNESSIYINSFSVMPFSRENPH